MGEDSEDDLRLIREMLENVIDDALLDNHAAELERRYGKASGTLKKVLFNSNYKSELEILAQIREKKML